MLTKLDQRLRLRRSLWIMACIAWTMLNRLHPVVAAEPRFTPDEAGFRKVADPFLKQHCLRCHGPKDEGSFRLDRDLSADLTRLSVKEKWTEVVNVLNGHEMPPADQPQPAAEDVAAVVDWATSQIVALESARRDSAIRLRRLNRAEYRNTIRDLTGIDFDISIFPEDASAGGFDNVGAALTMSPLQIELMLNAARTVLDEAIVVGERPPVLKWRIEPESGDGDHNRVTYDGQRIIVNGGKNRVEGDFVVMHHESWNLHVNTRDFAMPFKGTYRIRLRAAGKVPVRQTVVDYVTKRLQQRFDDKMRADPGRERWHRQAMNEGVEHFRTDRRYDYGPPRLKLVQHLAGQPRVIAEFDVDAPVDEPEILTFDVPFTTEKAGVTLVYDYSIPRELENFWMQNDDDFPRPEAWVDWIEIEGPIYDQWPPASLTAVLPPSELRQKDEREYAREVVRRWMTKAYRRPVSNAEVAAKMKLYDAVRPAADSLETAIKTPLTAVLASPHFLYLTEPTPAGATATTRRRLTDAELATRLSYFLWSGPPDDRLYELVAAGKLSEPAVRIAEVDRMLDDARSQSLMTNFVGQWLGLREVGANPPAADLYRRYDRHLEVSLVKESEAFFADILRNDRDAMQLIKSDFVVINERLARFYDIPDVRGDHFRRVPVPPGVARGGIVTQASILSITSNGTRTSPVKRGTWILKNLLGTDPGLPVANVGEIAPKVPGIDKATVRQRLEIHRELPQCARCHNKIDPLGFALENYDASGFFRLREGHGYQGRIGKNDPLIDAGSRLPDGTEIVGVAGLQDALLANEALFLNCLAKKLFAYALGREITLADQPQLDAAVRHMQANGRTIRSLLHFIATSEPFQTK